MSEIPIPEALRLPRNYTAQFMDESSAVWPGRVPELRPFIEENIQKTDFNRRFAGKLRGNQKITHLYWETGYTSQFMLDCITTMPNLAVLSLGYARMTDLSGLAKLKRLEFLSMLSTGSATNLDALCNLDKLVSLFLGISPKVTSLDAFNNNSLSNLRAFYLAETAERVIRVESLRALGDIQSLEYLVLGRVRPKDQSLTGIIELPHLKAFQFERNARYPATELDALRSRGVDVSTY